MTPTEYRMILRLEAKWKAKARRMPRDWPMRWSFVRERAKLEEGDVVEYAVRDEMVALCEIVERDQPFERIGMDGVVIRPELWALAGSLNAMTPIPLMVVLMAKDGDYWAKVDRFGPVGETRRLLVSDFRPLGS